MGGTLMVSRSIDNHQHYKKRLLEMEYKNVTVTAFEKDALRSLIREMKPDILLMGARFFECATPYKMGQLKREFPDIYMAALAIGRYPDELAMYFILNGVESYTTTFFGLGHWYDGLGKIVKKKAFVIHTVQEQIDKRNVPPKAAGEITQTEFAVILLICNRHNDYEIADVMEISRMTVHKHKQEIYRKINVRSSSELVAEAMASGLVTPGQICFCPRNYVVTPWPDNKGRRKQE